MSFANPHWFWALALLLPAALARVWGSLEGRDAVKRLVAERLRGDLVTGGGRQRARWVKFLAFATAYSMVIAALARPQWGEITQEVQGEGRNVMLAIDSSRSMLATDLKPDRLTRAKFAALDLIEALPEDHIGLMAFAGSAFVQVPLTTDREALAEAVDQLDIYSVAKGGTNLASAIRLAAKSFEDSGARQHALVLFTDGEELEGTALDAAQEAHKQGTVIVTVGVGSTLGAIIPNPESRKPGGDFVRDGEGEVVRSRLDTAGLEKIARAADGLFLHLDGDAMNSDLIRQTLSKLDTTETEAGVKTIPIERYQWPLGAGLLSLAATLLSRLWQRRPRAATQAAPTAAAWVGVCLLASGGDSKAGAISEAYQLYTDGEFDQAVTRYQDAIAESSESGSKVERLRLGLGAAHFQSGDFDAALEAYGKALLSADSGVQESAHYSLGNALFRAGEAGLRPVEAEPAAGDQPPAPPRPEAVQATLRDWYGAVDHYESTLAINTANADAAHNLDVVKRRIEELQRQQEEEEKSEDQENPEQQENQEEKQEDEQRQEGGEEQEQQQESESGEENEPQEDEGQPQENKEQGSGDPSQQQNEGDESKEQEGQPQGDGEERQAAEPRELKELDGGEQEVDPETGYSKEQARRALEALADEQFDLQPLRRRARARFYKDW